MSATDLELEDSDELHGERQVRLRLLTAEDAGWVVDIDQSTPARMALPQGLEPAALRTALDQGEWATDMHVAWAVTLDGAAVGYLFVSMLSPGRADVHIRLSPDARGHGVGRQALRLAADHHFNDAPTLRRIEATTQAPNVAMQRALVAAGFQLEGRQRDAVTVDSEPVETWSYALTRSDWLQAHATPDGLLLVHGLVLHAVPIAEAEGMHRASSIELLQEGARVTGMQLGANGFVGQLAGILHGDTMTFVFQYEDAAGAEALGTAVGRFQLRADERLELTVESTRRDGTTRTSTWVERDFGGENDGATGDDRKGD